MCYIVNRTNVEGTSGDRTSPKCVIARFYFLFRVVSLNKRPTIIFRELPLTPADTPEPYFFTTAVVINLYKPHSLSSNVN